MLRASITLAAGLSFMIIITPSFHAQGAGGGQARAGAQSARSGPTPTIEERTGGHAEARRLLPALLGRAHRRRCSSRSRASTPTSCSRPVSPPASGRTTSASTAGRRAAAASSRSSASDRRCCSCRRNQSFRSSSPNPVERKSVEDSFAKSILWGFTVAAETQRPRARGRDRLPPARRARRRPARSAGHLPRGPHAQRVLHAATRKAFPKNTEIDMTLTFANDAGGGRGGGAAGPRRARRRSSAAAGARRRRRRTRRRPVLRHRRQRHAVARRGDAARARRRSSSCPTTTTRRATTIRAPATAA